MKINKIKVKNYRGIKDQEMNFDKQVTVVTGPNGSGKTSLLNAIKYGITGNDKTPLNNEATAGYVSIDIDFGAKTTPYMPDVRQITRRFGDKNECFVGTKKTSSKSVMEMLHATCHESCTADVMKMMTSGSLFDAIRKGELIKTLLNSGMVPAEVDTDAVKKTAGFTKEATDLMEKYLPPMPDKYGIETIAEVYKTVYSERTVLKRQLKELEAKAVYENPAPVRTAEAVDKEIAVLNSGEDTKRLYLQQMAAYQRAVEKRQEIMKQIQELEKKLTGTKAVMPDSTQKKGLEDIRKRLQAKLANNSRTEGVLSGNIAMLSKALTNLEGSKCPLSEKLTCTTDKTEVREELKEQIGQNEDEMKRLQAEDDTLKERLVQCDVELQKYEDALATYQAYKAMFEKHKMLKETLPELPEKPTMPVAKEGAEDVTRRIEELKKERSEILLYKKAKEAEAEAKALAKTIEIQSELINGFAPKGPVYTKIMNLVLKDIQDYMNNRAKQLKSSLEIGILVDEDGVQFACRQDATKPFVNAALCSSGEQAFLLFLVTDLMNTLSQMDVLFLDDLDKLDAEAFKALVDLVTDPKVLDIYDNIFLSAVNHTDTIETLSDYSAKGRIELVTM